MTLHKVIGILLTILSMVYATGCAKKNITAGKGSPYKEDLASFRPKYPYSEADLRVTETRAPGSGPVDNTNAVPEKSGNINQKLATILDTLYQHNKAIRFMPGYRIQLYVGNVRADADAAKSYIYRSFPDLVPYVTFSQPTYRVKAGDFMNRNDAEHLLESIRLQYNSAVILPDKVEIKKALQLRQAGNRWE